MIIASTVGIIALIGVVGIVYFMRIRDQKVAEPASTEMSTIGNNEIRNSISEEPMNEFKQSVDVEVEADKDDAVNSFDDEDLEVSGVVVDIA